jgi:hypothetical protein
MHAGINGPRTGYPLEIHCQNATCLRDDHVGILDHHAVGLDPIGAGDIRTRQVVIASVRNAPVRILAYISLVYRSVAIVVLSVTYLLGAGMDRRIAVIAVRSGIAYSVLGSITVVVQIVVPGIRVAVVVLAVVNQLVASRVYRGIIVVTIATLPPRVSVMVYSLTGQVGSRAIEAWVDAVRIALSVRQAFGNAKTFTTARRASGIRPALSVVAIRRTARALGAHLALCAARVLTCLVHTFAKTIFVA